MFDLGGLSKTFINIYSVILGREVNREYIFILPYHHCIESEGRILG